MNLSGGFDGKVALVSKKPVEIRGRKEMNYGLRGHWYKRATLDSIICQRMPTLQ